MTVSVFIADDHGIVRDSLRFLVESSGHYRVTGTAGRGEEAVQSILAVRPDIAIVDMLMPDFDGTEITRRIRKQNADVRILILSIVGSASIVRSALAAGADGYVLKASSSEEFFEALDVIQTGRRFVDPELHRVIVDEQLLPATPEVDKFVFSQLSPREQQILPLVAEGLTSAQISVELNLAASTVDTYRSRIMQKLNARSVADLVRLAIRLGLTSANS